MDNISKIRKLVKDKFEEDDWKYHILPVVKYSKELAKIYKVDEEITELAALLHDIGRTDGRENDKEHHIIGIPIAKKILKEHNYSEEIIKQVSHCVESHRSSKEPSPETMTAKIIANADAMAHFDSFPIFFYWRSNCGDSFEEAVEWVSSKIEKDWNKKITLPEAKELVKDKYLAAKLLLDSLEEYK